MKTLLALLLLTTSALAQNDVATTISNGTIASTGVFQAVLAANGTRKGCLIQNQSGHVMYVYAGPTASATAAASVQLQPGQTFSCMATGYSVITDTIAMTGTTGDAFVANEQKMP